MTKNIYIVTFLLLAVSAILYAYSKGLLPTWMPNLASLNEQTPTTTKEGWKMYENTEFGFAFQYPEEWTAYEERDTNPYNKFEVGVTPDKRQYFRPFYVLIKKDTNRITNQFHALEGSALEINIEGKQATRYEYDGEVHHITIIIPVSEEYSFIIGNERNENVAEFEQIVASFRFLE